MKTHTKFLVNGFIKSFFNVFFVMISVVFILNILKEIEFFNEISQEQTFSETVENLCETMQFSFMFGLETASGPVIGCQLTAQTQSAVMFRKNNELSDAISIAAIKIYSPLIKKSLR